MKRKTHLQLHAKKIAVLGLLTGLSLIAFLIEALLPSAGIPGAKIGISNVFSLFAMILYGLPEALLTVTARTVIGSLFAGNPSLLLYSFTAGIAAALLSRLLLLLFPKISVVCISAVSAVFHNFVQLGVYCLLTETTLLLAYAPVLAVAGTLSGFAVGLCLVFTVKALPRSFFDGSAGTTSGKTDARAQS